MQPELSLGIPAIAPTHAALHEELAAFRDFGKETLVTEAATAAGTVAVYTNEFWTARQRDAHRLHEVSYRACFKPQLPRFFIERLTKPGDVVFDPFMGRGTTLLEAALLGRIPAGNDVNPLCRHLIAPRLAPPDPEAIASRLAEIDWTFDGDLPADLLVFYHEKTLREICALRAHLATSAAAKNPVDAWIRMVALNRLTGHSPGFFSVYTLPPNQAVSVASQRRINAQRNQVPPYRCVPDLIVSKSRKLLTEITPTERESLARLSKKSTLTTSPARAMNDVPANAAHLVVTSPPFLNVVDYKTDNWLRCWFAGIEPADYPVTTPSRLTEWQAEMTATFHELHRILKPGGHIAFEVGEVRRGKIRLEDQVLQAGTQAALTPELVLINAQKFTKTANCWGVSNNTLGTNTNRIVLFRKPPRPR